MNQDQIFSPFKLHVIVHSAQDLPIADITSSDPYVVLSVGEKNIGRTRTIYRSLNPEWDEHFKVNLLHSKGSLLLKIFDEDKYKDDDLMGSLEIDLSLLPIGKLVENTYPIRNAGAKARIVVSLLIGRNNKVITVASTEEVLKVDNEDIQDKLFENTNYLMTEKPWDIVPTSVQNTFLNFAAQRKSSGFPKDLLRDLLFDVSGFSHNKNTVNDNRIPVTVSRTKLKLTHSVKVVLTSKKYYRCAPIETNCIQLNLSTDETKFVLIKCPNRFLLWTWMKWLLTAYDFWMGSIRGSDLPGWTKTNVLSSQVTISTHLGKSSTGRGTLSLEKPFQITCNGQDVFSIRNVLSAILSVDSWVPKAYALELDIGAFDFSGATSTTSTCQSQSTGDVAPLQQRREAFQQNKKRSMMQDLVGGVVGTAGTVVKGAKDVVGTAGSVVKGVAVETVTGVAHTAVGVAHTAAGAVKVLAAGNPIKIIKETQDSVVNVGSTIINTTFAGAQTVLGRTNTFAVVKVDKLIHIIDAKDDRTSSVLIDLRLEDLEPRSNTVTSNDAAAHQSGMRVIRSPSSPLEIVTLPPKKKFPLSVDFYLLHGPEGMEKVMGQKTMKISSIIRNFNQSELSKGPQELSIPLDNELGLSLTIDKATDLAIPSDVLHYNSTIPGANLFGIMYAKCKLVDDSGHSRGKGGNDIRTPSIPITRNPSFNGHSFMFKASSDRIDKESFVRIELMVETITSIITVGAAFIPLSYFGKKETEYTFPVSRFRTPNNVSQYAAERGRGLGTVTVKIKKIEETNDTGKSELKAKATVREANIYNTSWFAECVLTGAMESTDPVAERVNVTPLYDGIRLVEIGISSEKDDPGSANLNDSVETSSKPLVDHQGKTVHTPATPKRSSIYANSSSPFSEEAIFEIEVYENDRKQPYPPFNWSGTAYTRAHYSDMKFTQSFNFKKLELAVPPDGWEWLDESWTADTKHLKTDRDGWFYGGTFGAILSNQERGKSYDKPTNCLARRRKWVRRARCKQGGTFDRKKTMLMFENANNRSTTNTVSGTASKGLTSNPSTQSMSDGNNPSIRETSNSVTEMIATLDWRKEVLAGNPAAVLATCREKDRIDADIFIPWSRVKSVDVITSSILSMTVEIERFFNTERVENAFRTVEVELFLSNCGAEDLKQFFDERKFFTRFRQSIKELVDSGNVDGRKFKESEFHLTDVTSSSIENSSQSASTAEIEDDFIPETEELSVGSEVMADLDHKGMELEMSLQRLDKTLAEHSTNEKLARQRDLLLARVCRIRLYMAALFGVELKGIHEYNAEKVTEIMELDFKRAYKISLDNDVYTANNRIEYLLDMAEKRIRDAALCGWKYRDGNGLEETLEIFANGYFIEIVEILAMFFNDQGMTKAKGLTSKLELINTFMRHNDRLDMILESALRPYGLKADPPAHLSLFLDFNMLADWYTSVLTAEMKSRVDSVLEIWRDTKKEDISGQLANYNFPLPWIPMRRSNSQHGAFFTNITEDLVELLMTYLQYARIRKENVAASFYDSIGKMDLKVCYAYSTSFMYLGERFHTALSEKEWFAMSSEEELAEYVTWISSVANDCYKLKTMKWSSTLFLTNANDPQEIASGNSAEVKESLTRTMQVFNKVRVLAIDQLSCILMTYTFHECNEILEKGVYNSWMEYLNNKINNIVGSKIAFFYQIVYDLKSFLAEYESYLEKECYLTLLHICADKLIVLLLSLFKEAKDAGAVFEPASIQILALAQEMTYLLSEIPALFLQPWITSGMHTDVKHAADYIPFYQIILTAELGSQELDNALTSIESRLQGAGRVERNAHATCIECCLSLRGVSKYYNTAQQKKQSATPAITTTTNVNQTARNRQSITLSRASLATNATRSSNANSPTPTKPAAETTTPSNTSNNSNNTSARRGSGLLSSMTNLFHFHHNTNEHSSHSSHGHQHDHHEKRPADAAAIHELSREDDEDDEENDLKLKLEMEQQRENALLACVDATIQVIRAVAKDQRHRRSTVSNDEVLVLNSPFSRVFGNDQVSNYSLKVQILQSALESKEMLNKQSPGASSTGFFNYFTFGKRQSSADERKKFIQSSEDKQQGNTTANDENGRNNTNNVSAAPSLTQPVNTTETNISNDSLTPRQPLRIITLRDMKLYDLFYLDTFRAPRPYLKINVGDVSARTSTKESTAIESQAFDWSDDRPIELQLFEVTSQIIVEITIMYEGFLSDQVVGILRIPLDAYNPSPFIEKKLFFTDFTKSNKALQAYNKFVKEGNDPPHIILTMMIE